MARRQDLRRHAVDLHQKGELDQARRAYGQFLTLEPKDAGIWSNLGVLHRAQGAHDMALRAHQRAHALKPDDMGIATNLANVLSDIGRYDESIALRSMILEHEPDSLNNISMIARCLRGKGDYAGAVEYLEAAMERFPDHAELQLQMAFALLGQGEYMTGFAAYQSRWQSTELSPRNLDYPEWQGEDLNGKVVTVLPEQGFGDTVLFARFLPVLKVMGAQVRLITEGPLHRLFEGVRGADQVVSAAHGKEPTDYWVNMIDLAIPSLGNDPDIPAPVALNVPGDSKDRAAAIVRPYDDKLKVGVVWTGSHTYKANGFRSFSHQDYLPFTDISGIQLFSLYKGPGLDAYYKDGADAFMLDVGSHDRDFADCAAMMQKMDLVITSDTATAHIAGSLGVPTWVILHWDPFWVWTHAGVDTPWYPSVRLFRQTEPQAWAPVMAEVKEALVLLGKGRDE